MRKYATVYEFGKTEIDDLRNSLEHGGFRVLRGVYEQEIEHHSLPIWKKSGYLRNLRDGKHLYVFPFEGNPLIGFVDELSARDSSPAQDEQTAGSPSDQ